MAGSRRIPLLAVLAAIGLVALVIAAPAQAASLLNTGGAPNCCGSGSDWAPGDNSFLGRAASPAATADDAWFTGSSGDLTNVFYPTLDTSDFTDQQFIVGDSGHTWDQTEKTDASHTVALANNNALAWTVTNTGSNGKWRITKTIYTDPSRPVVDEHVTFTVLSGTLSQYTLYQLSNPSQDGNGNNDTGQTVTFNSRQMLVATGANSGNTASDASALAVGNGLGWLTQAGTTMLSSGFVGTNDGWQDLLGGSAPDHTMSNAYSSATNGNIAQLGQFDLGPVGTQTSVSFDLAIGLGGTPNTAETNADAELSSLAGNENGALTSYESQWSSWLGGLNTYGGLGGEQFLVSAMGLKASQDPSSGAIVAGIGHPWGDSFSTSDPGYSRTWARDMYNIVTGLLLAGDNTDADSAVHFLFDHQQESDGHFPQNSFTSGAPSWTGIQLDETAYPIVLAWQLRTFDPALVGSSYYTNHILPAANYLVAHGPSTSEERWEENGGYSPSTIAAEIAGLYLASQIASQNGDSTHAGSFQSTADSWAANVASWTYTTNGPFGDGQYFVRITPSGNPNSGATVTLANNGGTYNENAVVDNGFLQLVDLGILPANDPRVANTIAVTANPNANTSTGSLEELLPNGMDFFRYNHDGYGEPASGGNWTGAGIGRLWPILDGEFGQYQYLLGKHVAPYVTDLSHYAASSGLLSEQVWDNAAPTGDTPGAATLSMDALNWSLSMYIQLVAAEYDQAHGIGGLPGQAAAVVSHYAGAAKPAVTTSVSPPVTGQPVTVRYNGSLAASATSIDLHWGHDGWQNVTDTAMAKQSDGSWTATVTVPAGTGLNTAFQNQSGTWDNNGGADYNLAAINATVSSSVNPLTTGSTTIRYAGSLAGSATSLTLHWGHDNWQGLTDTAMTKQADGSWKATITVPAGSVLNLDVFNQSNTWDNNNGANYGFAIR
ncbi:MAG TPA: glycoside hydrolase family 15 protein [Pseudonocardiaceae bacterium]|nr:glycoside hydrolase family 15 protein [Pseudonocardiaceae bacterium]